MCQHIIPSKLLVLVGPTGSGKTGVAIELCRLLGGEVVSADSMQIYRGCDIGTAKPTVEEQRMAPHHLIDTVHWSEHYSAVRWASDARVAVQDIRSRGKLPVICGGTGFYLRALLQPESLSNVPPNPILRRELEAEAAREGLDALYRRLAQIAPEAAARCHPSDQKRVIRALEIAEAPASAPAARSQPAPEAIVFGLEVERDVLYRRIEARVDAMLAAGFMREIASLVDAGAGPDSPAMLGVGYRQMLPALEDPEKAAECLRLWRRDTRRYAKRQGTWFRHQLAVTWIKAGENRSAAEIAGEIGAAYRALA